MRLGRRTLDTKEADGNAGKQIPPLRPANFAGLRSGRQNWERRQEVARKKDRAASVPPAAGRQDDNVGICMMSKNPTSASLNSSTTTD